MDVSLKTAKFQNKQIAGKSFKNSVQKPKSYFPTVIGSR